ncbi:hypothetical protein J5Y09_01395 [Roseomonas sp. PWR1]|uniref:Lipoprotein n=1 Tax=Roseomonas nitratireducens TaxID=2820810 RepID=A0ABS4ANX2_9PROT|nr:hypothetical protein [Neoroseomonas nitratireducens]MBP0462553.1 hypothetical protein [Neoroseomonas nitratireducens]
MIRRKLLALFALLGTGALAACAPQTVYVPQPVAVAQPPVAVGCDTRFTVVNNSSLTVMQLFFSHSSLANWGADQLGQNVLPPGRAWNYRAANAGNYDFRVVWQNGRAAELRRVNICAASRIVVTNSGLYAQ